MSSPITSLAHYRLLGRTGLRVSPLALGTMTFGTETGWGVPPDTAFSLVDRYLEAGGNFIDTADIYTGGTSEKILGDYFKARGTRDRVVLATKYSQSFSHGDPNGAGNGRKNLYRALHGSLERLGTDYLDLYWVHVWDAVTPVEEVMSTLNDMVRSGKVRAIGLSDVPAWYLSRAQTLAEWRGWERIAALQLEYSLVERNIEREHLVAARELGLGLVAWSPLGSGMLTGKYTRESAGSRGEGRLGHLYNSGYPIFEKLFTEKNWAIVDTLKSVAEEVGQFPAHVALNWVARRPGVTSTLLGASKLSQLEDNLRSLEFELPRPLREKLEAVSAPEVVHPYHFYTPEMLRMTTGGTHVSR